MSKLSATSKAIRSINNNLKTIANTFGIDSRQYQAAIDDLFRYDVRTDLKTGALQIRDTKSNRKQHQSLRARAKRNPNIIVEKRKSKKRMEQFNKRSKTKMSSIKAFEQMQQLQNDKLSWVYDIRDLAQEFGVEFSEYKAMQSTAYLKAKISEIEAEANQDIGMNDGYLTTPTVSINEDGQTIIIDKETGEILYTYGMD